MARDTVRALVTVGALAAAAAGLVRLAWLPGVGLDGLPHALAAGSPERSLPLVLAVSLAGFTVWLAVTVLLSLAAQAPGAAGRCALSTLQRVAPATVRRALAVTLGLSVLSGTGGIAQAAGPVSHVAISQPSTSPVMSLDWPVAAPASPVIALDRPVPVLVHHDPARGLSLLTSGPRAQGKVPAAQAIPRQRITVRPGDSLWRIAARALPRDTAPAVVERSWHRWYAANRGVIGADPNLIQPGQQLTPPNP
jgi:nucleoid-associated protein YgaU